MSDKENFIKILKLGAKFENNPIKKEAILKSIKDLEGKKE